MKKEYHKDSSAKAALDNKAANKKIDLDFILKSLEENIKTEEAFYQDSLQRVTKFMNLLSISTQEINEQQKKFSSGDNQIEKVQDLSDFFLTLSDCLGKFFSSKIIQGEKLLEIEEAEAMVEQVESKYGTIFYERLAFYICDELERIGSNPTICKLFYINLF